MSRHTSIPYGEEPYVSGAMRRIEAMFEKHIGRERAAADLRDRLELLDADRPRRARRQPFAPPTGRPPKKGWSLCHRRRGDGAAIAVLSASPEDLAPINGDNGPYQVTARPGRLTLEPAAKGPRFVSKAPHPRRFLHISNLDPKTIPAGDYTLHKKSTNGTFTLILA